MKIASDDILHFGYKQLLEKFMTAKNKLSLSNESNHKWT